MNVVNKICFTTLLVFITLQTTYSQSVSGNYKIKLLFSSGLSSHFNKPVLFPIGYTDASIMPKHQDAHIGYQLSVLGMWGINDLFDIGIIGNISKFGFTETGDELSFWSNEISDYSIDRTFSLYGFGLSANCNLIRRKNDVVLVNTSIWYENFMDTKGVYLFSESENRHKFSTQFMLEYAHKLTKNISLSTGLNAVISLDDYYELIAYRPIRYGVSFGVQYTFNTKK